MVAGWLERYILSEEEDSRRNSKAIADWFADYESFHSHGRRVGRDQARDKGVKVMDGSKTRCSQSITRRCTLLVVHHAEDHRESSWACLGTNGWGFSDACGTRTTDSVESVFAEARDTEAVAEEYLVDDGWKAVEVESEVVETHRNGNGHRDEAPVPQQSLFSWAEFLAEEPVRPKGHSRKPKPASTSLFEWAFTLESQREEELVGAGR